MTLGQAARSRRARSGSTEEATDDQLQARAFIVPSRRSSVRRRWSASMIDRKAQHLATPGAT